MRGINVVFVQAGSQTPRSGGGGAYRTLFTLYTALHIFRPLAKKHSGRAAGGFVPLAYSGPAFRYTSFPYVCTASMATQSYRSLFLLNILFFYFNIIFILFANYKKLEILTQNTKNIILIFFNILSHCLYVAMSYVEIMDPNLI